MTTDNFDLNFLDAEHFGDKNRCNIVDATATRCCDMNFQAVSMLADDPGPGGLRGHNNIQEQVLAAFVEPSAQANSEPRDDSRLGGDGARTRSRIVTVPSPVSVSVS